LNSTLLTLLKVDCWRIRSTLLLLRSVLLLLRSVLLQVLATNRNNLNSTVCRSGLCRYVQLCCRYGRLCRQCVPGFTPEFCVYLNYRVGQKIIMRYLALKIRFLSSHLAPKFCVVVFVVYYFSLEFCAWICCEALHQRSYSMLSQVRTEIGDRSSVCRLGI